jgi:hypothetical protein
MVWLVDSRKIYTSQVQLKLSSRLPYAGASRLCFLYNGDAGYAVDGWERSRLAKGSPAAAAADLIDGVSRDASAGNQSNIALPKLLDISQ